MKWCDVMIPKFNKKYEVETQQMGTYDPHMVNFYGLGYNSRDGEEVKSDDEHLVTLYLPLWQIILNYSNNIPVSIVTEQSFISICKDVVDIIRSNTRRGTMVNVTKEKEAIHEYSGITYVDVKKFYKFLLTNNKYAIADHFSKPTTSAFTTHHGAGIKTSERKATVAIDTLYSETIANPDIIGEGVFNTVKKKNIRTRIRKNKIQGWDE